MTRQYHTLCTLEDGLWAVHFGDYCMDSVRGERLILIDGGAKAKDMQILSTGDTQAAIEAAVSELNRRRA